jgi:hypothetical protein
MYLLTYFLSNDTTHLIRDQIRTELRRYFYIYSDKFWHVRLLQTHNVAFYSENPLNVAFYLKNLYINQTQRTNQVHMVRNPGCMKKKNTKFVARKASRCLWSQLDETMHLGRPIGQSGKYETKDTLYSPPIRTRWQFNILPSRPGGILRSLTQLLRSRHKDRPIV